MMTATTTQLALPATPKEYVQCSKCPQCGAPIFHDADAIDATGAYKTLPFNYYTCGCRFNVIAPIAPITPAPAFPLPGFPLPTTWIGPAPVRESQTSDPLPDISRTFCGSGGVSQDPRTKLVCYNKSYE